MVKKIRKSDIETLLKKEVSELFNIKDSDFETNVNSIYAEILFSPNAVPYEESLQGTSKITLEKHLNQLTNSNVKLVFFGSESSPSGVFMKSIKFAIDYEIVD